MVNVGNGNNGDGKHFSSQDWAKARLEKSPRHLEWVKDQTWRPRGELLCRLSEVKDKATAVLVIHEIFGLSDWVRSVTDQLAEAGYMPSRRTCCQVCAWRRRTAEMGGRDNVTKAVLSLPPDQVTADLNARWLNTFPSCLLAAARSRGGFCWGRRTDLRFATNNKRSKAVSCFRTGSTTNRPSLAYNARTWFLRNDNRVTSTVAKKAKR